jgi:hypothetical protein
MVAKGRIPTGQSPPSFSLNLPSYYSVLVFINQCHFQILEPICKINTTNSDEPVQPPPPGNQPPPPQQEPRAMSNEPLHARMMGPTARPIPPPPPAPPPAPEGYVVEPAAPEARVSEPLRVVITPTNHHEPPLSRGMGQVLPDDAWPQQARTHQVRSVRNQCHAPLRCNRPPYLMEAECLMQHACSWEIFFWRDKRNANKWSPLGSPFRRRPKTCGSHPHMYAILQLETATPPKPQAQEPLTVNTGTSISGSEVTHIINQSRQVISFGRGGQSCPGREIGLRTSGQCSRLQAQRFDSPTWCTSNFLFAVGCQRGWVPLLRGCDP